MSKSIILISLISFFLIANAADEIKKNENGLETERIYDPYPYNKPTLGRPPIFSKKDLNDDKSLLHLTKPTLYEKPTMTFPLHSKPAIIDENESLESFDGKLPRLSKRQWNGGFSGNTLGSLSGSVQGSHNFGNGWSAGGGFGLNNGKPTHYNANIGHKFSNGVTVNGGISTNGNLKPTGAQIGVSIPIGGKRDAEEFGQLNEDEMQEIIENRAGGHIGAGISVQSGFKPNYNLNGGYTFNNGVNVNGNVNLNHHLKPLNVNLNTGYKLPNGITLNGGLSTNGNLKPTGAQIGVSIPIGGKRDAEELNQIHESNDLKSESLLHLTKPALYEKPTMTFPLHSKPAIIDENESLRKIVGGINPFGGRVPILSKIPWYGGQIGGLNYGTPTFPNQNGVSIPTGGKRDIEEFEQTNENEIMQAERVSVPYPSYQYIPYPVGPFIVSKRQENRSGGQIGGGVNWQAGSKPNFNLNGGYTFNNAFNVNGGLNMNHNGRPTGAQIGVGYTWG